MAEKVDILAYAYDQVAQGVHPFVAISNAVAAAAVVVAVHEMYDKS